MRLYIIKLHKSCIQWTPGGQYCLNYINKTVSFDITFGNKIKYYSTKIFKFNLHKEKKNKKEKKTKSQKLLKKKNIATKLITNTKRQKLKIWSRVWHFRNTMLKKRRKKREKKGHKNYKIYIYMKFAFKKNGVFFFFFCKVIGYKNEN